MIREKAFILVVLLLTCCLTCASPALAASPLIIVDGKQLQSEAAALIENGRILVPLRAIFESLSASVYWDAPTRSITASTGCDTIILTIDSSTAYKNGFPILLDVEPQIVGGYTLVPLRFVAEALGADVLWDASSNTVTVASNPYGGST